MKEEHVFYVIIDPETKEFYAGISYPESRRTNYKFHKQMRSAVEYNSRKEANEYIKYNLRMDNLKVKKMKVIYSIS